jgi:RNA polymerase sigma-54 factor
MQLTQSASLRQELRQLLTPRMIQSMEILQLPLLALEERIEQELQNNPVLEFREPEGEAEEAENEPTADAGDGEKVLVVKEDSNQADDFERLAKIGEYLENEEFFTNQGSNFRQASYDGERDKKLDAMNNTAARGITLTEHLQGQWAFVECTPDVRKAGEVLINYITDEGYLRTDLETVQKESKHPLKMEDLAQALRLIQSLEPAGVGARNLKECLLLQLNAIEQEPERAEGHDF